MDWGNIIVTTVATSIATFIAAFVGVDQAFKKEREKRKEDREAEQVEIVERALFALTRAHGYLSSVDKNFCKEIRDDLNMRLLGKPFLEAEWSVWNLELGSLSFLFHSEDPKILLKLFERESAYKMIRSMMTRRSQMSEQHIQPIIQQHTVKDAEGHDVVHVADIANAIGRDLTTKMVQISQEIVDGVEKELGALVTTQRSLHTLAKTMFPDKTIVCFVPTANTSPPPAAAA